MKQRQELQKSRANTRVLTNVLTNALGSVLDASSHSSMGGAAVSSVVLRMDKGGDGDAGNRSVTSQRVVVKPGAGAATTTHSSLERKKMEVRRRRVEP